MNINTHDENTDVTATDTSCDEVSSTITSVRSKESHEIPVTQQLILLASILFLLLGSALIPRAIALLSPNNSANETSSLVANTTIDVDDSPAEKQAKPFADITLVGQSAYVWDIQEQRALYKKNESQQLPLASITKLMTALVSHELLSEQTPVIIEEQAILQDGDSGLLRGESFTRISLSDLVLMSSSNDGAYALALATGNLLTDKQPAYAFVNAMNIRAKELSLHNTYFKNPTGLDISETEGGAYGTAKDVAFLMEYIVVEQPDILASTQELTKRVYSQDGVSHDETNTNHYINKIPGLIGSKTGFTDLAGGNLVVAFNAGLNRPIIISVLNSTKSERFADVLKLVDEVQKYVTK